VCAVKQFEEVVIIDAVMELFGNGFELLEFNGSIFIFVEKSKYSPDPIFCLGFSNFRGNDIQKLLPSNGLIFFFEAVDKGQNKWISLVQSKFFKDLIDFNWINGSAAIFIEDFKCLLELFVILGGKSVFPGA
jgi:hypothetical protein